MTTIDITDKFTASDNTAHSKSWLVLPVCPKINFHIKFNEGLGKGRAIPMEGALTWLKESQQQGASIDVLEIGGPGDPLATPELTLELASKIFQDYPEIQLQISTLGLHGAQYASEISKAGITSVTLLVDTVSPEIAQKIYAWIRPGKKTVPLKHAVDILVHDQKLAIQAFKDAGLHVTVRTTVYPGYNDEHIETIAKTMATHGANSMTLVPFKSTAIEKDNDLPSQADKELMQKLLKQASKHLPKVTIYEKESSGIGMECTSLAGKCISKASMLPKPTKEKPNIAVVSSNGMEIDLHLGQAYQVLIYGPREDGLPCLLETRPAPDPGGGGSRWEELAKSLNDCFALLTASAGEKPRKILGQHGVTVLITDGEIEGTADALFGGEKKCKK